MAQESTKFGIGQIGNVTPSWAKWVFRIFFYVTSTVTLYLSVLTNLPMETKLHITEIITFANLAVHGLSKMFGIKDEPIDFYDK